MHSVAARKSLLKREPVEITAPLIKAFLRRRHPHVLGTKVTTLPHEQSLQSQVTCR